MTDSASRIWTPRSGQCNATPFRTGVDRALADAFPPVNDAVLPDRIVAALIRLARESGEPAALAALRPEPL